MALMEVITFAATSATLFGAKFAGLLSPAQKEGSVKYGGCQKKGRQVVLYLKTRLEGATSGNNQDMTLTDYLKIAINTEETEFKKRACRSTGGYAKKGKQDEAGGTVLGSNQWK
ncbi:hypothetical protein CEXT_606121 [Caerostris extrusa]|uniref:Uncharacterized protein n=1 Tax=Caerostris extrusa TaxID=172846 RepID=A0AAV4SHU9_CAEEX|nr:hypothetical protein CEXT_606121 [Caerostris extrusa]